MFRDSIIAAIRTGVAFLVTWLIAHLVGWGVQLDPELSATLNIALFGLCVAGYNFVVGLLERKVNPYFGVLLGIPKAPAYGAVGTQTPPPNDPLIGNPPADRGAANLLVVGLVICFAGLIVWLVTTADVLGIILIIAGVAVAAAGASQDRRL